MDYVAAMLAIGASIAFSMERVGPAIAFSLLVGAIICLWASGRTMIPLDPPED